MTARTKAEQVRDLLDSCKFSQLNEISALLIRQRPYIHAALLRAMTIDAQAPADPDMEVKA